MKQDAPRFLWVLISILIISCGDSDEETEENQDGDNQESSSNENDGVNEEEDGPPTGNDLESREEADEDKEVVSRDDSEDADTGIEDTGQEDTEGEDIEFTEIDDTLPPPGYEGGCAIPEEGRPEDISNPDIVIGDGTPQSCTSDAVVNAVAAGGIITFNCGPEPVTITMEETAKVFNDTGPEIVLDGGGLVTLSGGGKHRILYMNTCDENQVWTTSHCDNQDHPRLTVQNLTFVDANSKSETEYDGGGAIWSRGGRLKVVNCRFFNNVCADEGPDVGGGGIRAFDQYNAQPIYVVHSTFGGREDLGNVCANGGGISSIGVSWTVINSLFTHNQAIGNGGNPAEDGTPGGGSGGAIYNDGNTMTLSLCGTNIEYNEVNAYGAAIFFVSNDHSGTVALEDTIIQNNIGGSWHTLPGIAMHDDTNTVIDDNTILQNGK